MSSDVKIPAPVPGHLWPKLPVADVLGEISQVQVARFATRQREHTHFPQFVYRGIYNPARRNSEPSEGVDLLAQSALIDLGERQCACRLLKVRLTRTTYGQGQDKRASRPASHELHRVAFQDGPHAAAGNSRLRITASVKSAVEAEPPTSGVRYLLTVW